MNVCQVRYCGTNDMLTGVAQSESKQVAGWLCLASWAPVKVKHRNRPSSDNNKALHADGLAQTHDTSPEGGGGPPALGVNSTHTQKNGRKGERFSVLFLSLPTRGNPAPPPAQKSSSRLWNGRRRVVVTARHCCHFLGARRLTN